MIKEWRTYWCEGKEPIEVLCQVDEVIPLCNDDNSPVMVTKKKPNDKFIVAIISMEYVGEVSNKISASNRYKLQLTSLVDDTYVISEKSFSKDQALEILSLLIGLERKAALKVWDSKCRE